ncbi:MAG: DUF2384 domain-containing protein [Proteobacteria bacterium]|nr:DUF2384 domain-containing protein [Pseudomonadota bacterium]
MQPRHSHALRTRVYVDGYNLYFGRLKNSSHKWLDLRAFAGRILTDTIHEPSAEPIRYRFVTPAIKYFSAPILESFAKSDNSSSRQLYYYDALAGHSSDDFEMVSGYYHARPARAYKCEEGKAARDCDRVEIWKLEEKQSDVALALHAYSDAILAGNVNAQLEKHADWVRRDILDDELACSQLPPLVRRHNSVVRKPLSWYPRPDLLVPIFNEAKRVRGSVGAAHKWMHQPCRHLDNRIPIAMCERDDSARELRIYMEAYALEFGL